MWTNVQDVTYADDVPSHDTLAWALNHDISNRDTVYGVCCDMKNELPDNQTARNSMWTDSELQIIASIEFWGLGAKKDSSPYQKLIMELEVDNSNRAERSFVVYDRANLRRTRRRRIHTHECIGPWINNCRVQNLCLEAKDRWLRLTRGLLCAIVSIFSIWTGSYNSCGRLNRIRIKGQCARIDWSVCVLWISLMTKLTATTIWLCQVCVC